MTTMEVQFNSKLAEDIDKLGYDVKQNPSRVPSRTVWQDRWEALLGRAGPRPDILVEHGDKFVLIEAKVRPVSQGNVIQARNYADHYGTEVVLCVPEEASETIPSSVRDFADLNGIPICSQSELKAVLKSLLC